MNKIATILSIILIFIFLAILVVVAWKGFNFIDPGFVSNLLGAFFGAVAVAIVIFGFQLRMEQTRYFFEVINQINDIFSQKSCWHLNPTTREWESCEFSRAVGTALWQGDPCGDDGNGHKKLECKEEGIEWSGVLYKIDDRFIIASKPLHDYANWIRLLISGYDSMLLSKTHIRFLWRSIVDAVAQDQHYGKRLGMRKWTEFFVLGHNPTDSSKKKFNKLVDIISNYSPSKQYLETKNFRGEG